MTNERVDFDTYFCDNYADDPQRGVRSRFENDERLCGNRASFMVINGGPNDGFEYLSPICKKHALEELNPGGGGFPSIPMTHFKKIWKEIKAAHALNRESFYELADLIDPVFGGEFPPGSLFDCTVDQERK